MGPVAALAWPCSEIMCGGGEADDFFAPPPPNPCYNSTNSFNIFTYFYIKNFMALSRSENGMGGTPGKGVNFPPPLNTPLGFRAG